MRFAKGDIGMFYWWTPYFYLCRKDGYMSGKDSIVADKIGIVPLPHSDKPQVVSIGGWSLGMTANSAAPDEAWAFIKWATSAKAQKAMGLYNKYGYQFSDFSRKSLYKRSRHAEDLSLPARHSWRRSRSGNGKISRPAVPTYTTLESIYGLNLNKVLTGELTPDKALKETAGLWTNVLKGNFLIPYKLQSYDDTLAATKALIEKPRRLTDAPSTRASPMEGEGFHPRRSPPRPLPPLWRKDRGRRAVAASPVAGVSRACRSGPSSPIC